MSPVARVTAQTVRQVLILYPPDYPSPITATSLGARRDKNEAGADGGHDVLPCKPISNDPLNIGRRTSIT